MARTKKVKFVDTRSEEEIELSSLTLSIKSGHFSDEDKKIMASLLEKKKQVMEKNGFFANFQLDRINKKIYKIKAKYKEK